MGGSKEIRTLFRFLKYVRIFVRSLIGVSSYYKMMIYLRESQGANPIGKALVMLIQIVKPGHLTL